MTDLLFPSTAELEEVAQDKLPRLIADRPVFTVFPIETSDNYLLMWEQKDNYLGLAQVRGLNATAGQVWGLIDGVRSVDEICSALAKLHQRDAAEVEKDVAEFLSQLDKRALTDTPAAPSLSPLTGGEPG